MYSILGWQAQPYIGVKDKAKKLAKLIIEQGNATAEKKTLTVGETWDVGDGWTVSAQSIDAKASPRQVWLVLSKDGVKKDDKVLGQGKTYVYIEKSFAGESDVPLFVTYIDSVFAGATSDMVQLRYTWAISTSVTELKNADVFGNMEVITAGDNSITLRNKDRTISLSKDTTTDIMGDLKFKVADSDTVRYYPMALRTAPGTYEVRGSVAEGTGTKAWDASTFAGFWYDLKDNKKTENLQITSAIVGRDIQENTLWYNTTRETKTLKAYSNQPGSFDSGDLAKFTATGMYSILGWQAQPYIGVKDKAKKLAKLIIEQGNATAEKKTLTVGETWDVGDGWTVSAQSIDAKASPRQVWLVLSKDGVKKDDKVLGQGKTYVYIEKSFAGESDVPLFVTYIDSVFAGATSDMVQLRYTWAISTSVTEVKNADVFGNMEVITAGDNSITLRNKDRAVTLSQDSTVDIMGELKFKVADDATTVRYYPKVDYQILGAGVTPTGTATVTGTAKATPKGNETVTATAAVTAAATTVAPAATEKAPAATATPKEPGFEAVFAIAGLLAVAYLVLRQRK